MNLSVGTDRPDRFERLKRGSGGPGPAIAREPQEARSRSYWTSVFFVVVVVEVILRTTIGPLALVRVV